MDRILKTEVPNGAAMLWWLGQMGLMVKIGKTVVCMEYFATPGYGRQTEPPIPTDGVRGVDAFLGTHDHLDHIDHEAWRTWAVTNPEAKFVFPRAHSVKLSEDGINGGRGIGINAGESVSIGDITIHAVAAAHEFLDMDPDTRLYPYLQYIIEGNGVRIHHAGDTVRYEGMLHEIRQYGKLDAELLPINGRDGKRYRNDCIGNMTFQEAADFAGETETSLVIPGHWDMFSENSEDPDKFADYLDAKYRGRVICKIPKVMEPILITSDSGKEG